MGDSGQVLLLAKKFQEKGHEVTIVTTDGDPFFNNFENSVRYSQTRTKLESNVGKIIKIQGIPVIPIHCTFPKQGMFSLSAYSLSKKIIKDFDLIHIYSWYHHLAFVFYKTAIATNTPVFVSMWGTLLSEAQKFNSNKKKILDFLYTKNMIKQVSGLHSIGTSETNEYLKWGADKNKIHYIDNGVVLENFEILKPTNIFKKLSLDHDDYVLYLGRIHEKKGIELLLKGFGNTLKKFENLKLVIAGSGEEEYVKSLKNFVSNLDFKHNVIFAGLVTEEEKLELLKEAKIFALTSYSDIHPRAVQEALVMGTPVMITDVCDYPEVQEYNAGKIVSLDENQISNTLIQILEDKEFLANCSTNAKKLIKEKFLLNEKITKYEQMYQKVLNVNNN